MEKKKKKMQSYLPLYAKNSFLQGITVVRFLSQFEVVF